MKFDFDFVITVTMPFFFVHSFFFPTTGPPAIRAIAIWSCMSMRT
ncbi:hypothetical protein [Chlorobium sp.]|nr:hypothetical protein [Chlorobium sp.]